MHRAPWVLGGLAVLAIAEIALIVWVAGAVGIGWTLLALLVTAVAGAVLWRREGVKALESLRDAQTQRDPQQVGQQPVAVELEEREERKEDEKVVDDDG